MAARIVTRAQEPPPAPVPGPPATRQDNVRETLHGVELVDPYRWLEDQQAPDTRAFIDHQNQYAHRLLDPLPGLPAIRSRLAALMRRDTQGAPVERAGRYFTLRRGADDPLPILYVRDRRDGTDAILLDPRPLSADHTTSLSLEDIAMNGRVLVYGVRTGGEDETELRVKDVDTLQDLPDRLPRALYRGVTLQPDGKTFYYARQDRATGIRIHRHVLGTPIDLDDEIFGEGFGPSDWIDARVSENGRHIVFTVAHGWASTEVYVQALEPSAARPSGSSTRPLDPSTLRPSDSRAVPVVRGIDAHVTAQFAGDRLIAQTDWHAPLGRIVEIDPSDPSPDKWRDIVPSGQDALDAYALVGGRLVVQRLHDVTARLDVYGLDGTPQGEIALPTRGTVRNLSGRWDADELFFDFESYTTPGSTYRATVAQRTTAPFWRPVIPLTLSGTRRSRSGSPPKMAPGSRCSSCTVSGWN